jgi:hypothetical protein
MRAATGAIVCLVLSCFCPPGKGQPAKDDEDVQVVKALLARFDAPKLGIRTRCQLLLAIGKFGAKAKDAVPRIQKFLEDELARRDKGVPRYLVYETDEHVSAAVRALGDIGPPAVSAVKTLIVVLKEIDGDRDVNGNRLANSNYRQLAAVALGRIGGKEALIELRASALGDVDEGVRKAAAEAIKAVQAAPAGTAADGNTGTVTGRVSYKGQPLPGGVILFRSANGTSVRALIDATGAYQAQGVPVGAVRVAIDAQPGAGKAPAVLIPLRYSDPETSGIRHTVQKGSQTFNIEMK